MKTIDEVKNFVKTDDSYSFLKTNELLNEKLIMLTLGGSISYGTEKHDNDGNIISDIDVRGIVLPPVDAVMGINNFEQFIHNQTDTVIYDMRKFFSLISMCNPNTLEILGSVDRNSIYVSPIAQQIIENKDIFISRRAINSFGGYATAQFDRLENALSHDSMTEHQTLQHMRNSLLSIVNEYNRKLEEIGGYFTIYLDKSTSDCESEEELFADISLKHYPLRDYKNTWTAMNDCVKSYGKYNHRAKKKDGQHLLKHAMHLTRLYLTGTELLETGNIVTYRENNLELLNNIRNGKFSTVNDDGDTVFTNDFYDLVEDCHSKFEHASQHTELPKHPDYDKINSLSISILKNSL